jgi:Bacterial pre-peptidase C-terminal domain
LIENFRLFMSPKFFVPFVLASAIALSVAPQRLQATGLPLLLASSIVLDEQGALAEGDSVLPDDGSLLDIHAFEGNAGQTITIDVESNEFDPFLIVLDAEGQLVGKNDDISPENTNARLTVTLPKDGVYRAIVNGYDHTSRGQYRLKIELGEPAAATPQ